MIDAGLPVPAFFTTREGGTSVAPYASLNVGAFVGDEPSAVALNRAVVDSAAGTGVTYLVAEHGIGVHRVVDPAAPVPPADVLVTTVPGVALATIGADCAQLLLHDAATGAVGAAHIGRKGLWAGTVDAAIAALLNLRPAKTSTALISASVGPAICGKCYEVPPAMRLRMGARHPSAVSTTRWGTPAIDIPRAVETRLDELGIADLVVQPHCTFEDQEFFSHRRDGVTGRQCGVVVCGVSLRDEPIPAP